MNIMNIEVIDIMKNILMLTPDYPPNVFGGIGTYVYYLAHSLEKKGWYVTVVVIRCDLFISSNFTIERNNNIEIIRFTIDQEKQNKYKNGKLDYYTFRSIIDNINASDALLKYLHNKSFSLIHVHDHYVGILFDILKTTFSIPSVTTIHSCKASEEYFEDSIRRYVSISTDHVIAVSESIKKEIIRKYAQKEHKITVIPGGLGNVKDNIVSEKDNIISFCGRLIPSKGCDILIKAFAQLKQNMEFDNLSLIIMGDGDQIKELNTLVKDLNLYNVEFRGWVSEDEVRSQIAKSTIHVVPSLYEPFGLSALEAMAEGTCVCASNVGGIKDFITHNHDGILIEPNNVNILSIQLENLLYNSGYRNRLAENALVTAKSYCFDNMIEKVIEIYENLLV